MTLLNKLFNFGKKAILIGTVAASLSINPDYSDAQILRRRARSYPSQQYSQSIQKQEKEKTHVSVFSDVDSKYLIEINERIKDRSIKGIEKYILITFRNFLETGDLFSLPFGGFFESGQEMPKKDSKGVYATRVEPKYLIELERRIRDFSEEKKLDSYNMLFFLARGKPLSTYLNEKESKGFQEFLKNFDIKKVAEPKLKAYGGFVPWKPDFKENSVDREILYLLYPNNFSKYEFDDLEGVLGKERWENIPEKNRNNLRYESKSSSDDKDIRRIYNIYSNPEEYLKTFSAKKRKEIEEIDVSKLEKSQLEEYLKAFPWKPDFKSGSPDRILLKEIIDAIENP
jgi:hypothetical protein